MTARHFLVDSPVRLDRVVEEIRRQYPFSRSRPIEIVVRALADEKSERDRRRFHFICREAAPRLALTPRETKELLKAEFYGREKKVIGGRTYEFVQSSEDSDREEYERLIAFALQFLAEHDVVIQFNQPQTGE